MIFIIILIEKTIYGEVNPKIKLFRWNVIREQRERDKEADILHEKRMIFNTFWKKFYGTTNALKTIFSAFHKKREERRLHAKMLYCANRIKRKFHRRISKYGDTLQDRNQNLGRYAIYSIMPYLQEPTEIRASKIVKGFVSDTCDRNTVFQSFLYFAKAADRIVSFYKKRVQLKKIYMYVLDKNWDKQYINITQNNLLGKQKPKKIAKIMKKIYAITNDTKEKVIRLYYDF